MSDETTLFKVLGNAASYMEREEERSQNYALRPQALEEFVGQERALRILVRAIDEAKARDDILDPVLLYGPPGVGKTSLGEIVAQRMERPIVAVKSVDDKLIRPLRQANSGDIFFVDEIHTYSTRELEQGPLYPVVEDRCISLTINGIKQSSKPVTVIAATTDAGGIPRPLYDRFGFHLFLDYYSQKELSTLIARSASKLDVDFPEYIRDGLAYFARGVPRVANRLVRRARDYRVEDVPTMQTMMRDFQIDPYGIEEIERRYLYTIAEHFSGGPVGLTTLSGVMVMPVATITELVEPYLLRKKLIELTGRGRKLTHEAFSYLRDVEKGGWIT